MHIIVDGYNIIRQSDTLRRHEKLSLEAGRNALINRISLYKKRRGHRVTIVFDGWEGGEATEERDRQSGIDIIYSRRGEKADDVIKKMFEKKREETVIVTSDRDIADFARRRGGTAIPSPEFEALMNRLITAMPESTGQPEPVSKEDEEQKGDKKKRGPSRRLPRKKKAAMATMRKL
jgi:uncharacterized protein